ncbi:MAG: S8 family serine peptidase [Candidatus Sericytochromatia bacterium]|nr:S8 family serine peptidase [Candidatus Sericytochromatia bacterium]
MRAIIRKWVAQIVTISMLAGCVLPQGQTIWGGNNTLSQNSATAPDSDDVWDGDIKLEIDPGLMGDKYKHLKKVPFASDSEGEDFSIQSSHHYKNYKKYLKPEFQCVQSLPDGSFRAYFGYNNTHNNTITIPIGSKNKVLPAEPMLRGKHKKKKKFDQGQPTQFSPGRVGPFPNSAFSVDFDHGNVHWLLNGKIAKANKRSTSCPVGPTPTPQPTQTPSATPTPTLPPSPTPTPVGSPIPTPSPTPTPVPTDTPTPTPEPTEEPTPTPMPTPSDVVFDPADPSTLGDLFPDVPGNNPNVTVPETTSTLVSLNNQLPSEFKTGQLAIVPNVPIQEILARYNATLASPEPVGGFYLIQADLSTVNLSLLEGNLQQLNLAQSNAEFLTTSASFASLEAAKTFALQVELMVSDQVKSISLDYSLTNGSVRSQESQTINTVVEPDLIPKAEDSWWLNETSTNVMGAWNYTMGYNIQAQRPVKVAVIDQTFGGLESASSDGGDLDGRVLWDEGRIFQIRAQNGIYINQTTTWTAEAITSESIKPLNNQIVPGLNFNVQVGTHGTQVSSTLASSLNNGRGVAGVAPHAQIIPIKIGNGEFSSWFDLIYALSYLNTLAQSAEVINMSLWAGGTGNVFMSDWSKSNLAAVGGEIKDAFYPLELLTNQLASKGVILVACAGNGGWDYRRNFPANPGIPNIISVGALEPTLTFSSRDNVRRAIFSRVDGVIGASNFHLPPILVGNARTLPNYASNWGSLDIWAPGNNMLTLSVGEGLVLNPDGTNSYVKLAETNGTSYWNGTSAAAPVVSGIAALLKSVKPSINLQEFRQVLVNTSYQTSFVDENLRGFPQKVGDQVTFGEPLPIQTMNIRLPNALAAIQSLGPTSVQLFRGNITPPVASTYTFTSSTDLTQLLDLYWGGTKDKRILDQMYFDDHTVNPPVSRPLTALLQTDEVEIEGWRSGNRLYFTQIRKVTPVLLSKQWKLKVFNLNDKAEVFINGIAVDLNGSQPGGELVTNTGAAFSQVDQHIGGIDVTNILSDTGMNTIEFKVYNHDQNLPSFFLPFPYAGKFTSGESIDNGSSWGFELLANNEVVYRDIRGNAASDRFTGIPRFGARRGSFSQGLVLHETLYVSKDGSVPVPSGPYQLRMYNVSDISRATVNGQSFQITAQSPFETFYNIDALMTSPVKQFSFEVLATDNTSIATYPRDNPGNVQAELDFPTHNLPALLNHFASQRPTYTWGFDVYRDSKLIYRNRDGERENLDIGFGDYRSFPAGGRFNSKAVSVGERVLNEHIEY